jgi:hypothetical protein
MPLRKRLWWRNYARGGRLDCFDHDPGKGLKQMGKQRGRHSVSRPSEG